MVRWLGIWAPRVLGYGCVYKAEGLGIVGVASLVSRVWSFRMYRLLRFAGTG